MYNLCIRIMQIYFTYNIYVKLCAYKFLVSYRERIVVFLLYVFNTLYSILVYALYECYLLRRNTLLFKKKKLSISVTTTNTEFNGKLLRYIGIYIFLLQ